MFIDCVVKTARCSTDIVILSGDVCLEVSVEFVFCLKKPHHEKRFEQPQFFDGHLFCLQCLLGAVSGNYYDNSEDCLFSTWICLLHIKNPSLYSHLCSIG